MSRWYLLHLWVAIVVFLIMLYPQLVDWVPYLYIRTVGWFLNAAVITAYLLGMWVGSLINWKSK
jgi:hypothetical protein